MVLKKLFSISVFILLVGCMQTTFLKNGHTRVVHDPKVYQNRVYFDPSILTQIDTTVIYEKFETNYYNGLVKQENILARYNQNNPSSFYGVYRFYGNGNYSLFFLDRKETVLTPNMFDPSYSGWRGILYMKNGKIMGDLITQVGELGSQIGTKKQEFTVQGDTLYVQHKNSQKELYIKRTINPELLKPKAEW